MDDVPWHGHKHGFGKLMKPSVRRIVTAHDAGGSSIFRADDLFETKRIPSGDADFALLWTTLAVPADNGDETDGALRPAGLTLKGGSAIRIVDMLPGKASPMHRSHSIDYGIVISGHLELELDGGATRSLGPGDVVIQRGTNHLWRNPSQTEACRIVFILIEALPVMIDGSPLPEQHP